MNRETWYALHHTLRYTQWAERQKCIRRREFRRAVKAMYVNRAVRKVIESNVKFYERILREN